MVFVIIKENTNSNAKLTIKVHFVKHYKCYLYIIVLFYNFVCEFVIK